MKRVIIESPYAGDIRRNTAYAHLCLRDSIRRGEAPIASHLLYPQVLAEQEPKDRLLGIKLGYEWMRAAELIVFYRDFGISKGMVNALCEAQALHIPIENRYLSAQVRDISGPQIIDPRDIERELGIEQVPWWKRWLRAIWSEPIYVQQAVLASARQAESCGKNSEPRETLCNDGECGWSIPHTQGVLGCIYEREPDNETARFINSTLSRDAPSPVPWGEANDLK